jgi:DNA repair ATPase RecN
MLSHLSASTQVLCFTHHEHLLGIAERSIGAGAFMVHRVEPVADMQAA